MRKEVLPLVQADLCARVEKGTKEYGEPLMTNNGRDALWDAYEEVLDLAMYLRQRIEEERDPIPMILHCPSCHEQNIDKPEPIGFCDDGWTNPPHRSHLCYRCGTIWRPADVPTVGVEKIQTKGKDDKIVEYIDPEKVEKVSRALRGGEGWKQR